MPSFVDQPATKVRKDPLGPVTLNQAHANIEVIDSLVLREHFDDGQHNALEVPWVLGHVAGGGTTGYLFDAAYGGGSISRPSTGALDVSVASGGIGLTTGVDGSDVPAASVIANVSDSAVASKPHVVEVELVSQTLVEVRTRYLTSTLGSPGNAWASVDVGVDLAVHAQKQPVDVSILASHDLKRRRDFLTEAATDWNALAQNQGTVRKTLSLEHSSAGVHSVNRIARASGWFRPTTGPAFTEVVSHRIKAVTRISTGVIEVEVIDAFSSTSNAACFCQVQPASVNELVLINGYCTATAKFRFYIYAYSIAENKWARADRSFTAAFFGSY